MENNQKEIILLQDLGYLYPKETSKQKRKFGLYKCFCGNEFKTQVHSVKIGLTTSCGCYHKQRTKEINKLKTTHGLTKHRLYKTWNGMMQRCNNIRQEAYKYYGSKKIIVCDRWLDINNFIEDMYPSYLEGLSIDRIDNNKGYSKDNCRWVNMNIQNRNKRKLQSNNKSGYRGVSQYNNKWVTKIIVNSKSIHLGYFHTAEDGAKAYDDYVIKHNLEHTKNFNQKGSK